jgi:hypothetical protein
MKEIDSLIYNLLPFEVWHIVIGHLPRVVRHSLSKLDGFEELINGKIINLESSSIKITIILFHFRCLPIRG